MFRTIASLFWRFLLPSAFSHELFFLFFTTSHYRNFLSPNLFPFLMIDRWSKIIPLWVGTTTRNSPRWTWDLCGPKSLSPPKVFLSFRVMIRPSIHSWHPSVKRFGMPRIFQHMPAWCWSRYVDIWKQNKHAHCQIDFDLFDWEEEFPQGSSVVKKSVWKKLSQSNSNSFTSLDIRIGYLKTFLFVAGCLRFMTSLTKKLAVPQATFPPKRPFDWCTTEMFSRGSLTVAPKIRISAIFLFSTTGFYPLRHETTMVVVSRRELPMPTRRIPNHDPSRSGSVLCFRALLSGAS